MVLSRALDIADRYVRSIPKDREVTAEEAMICANIAQAEMLQAIANTLQAMTLDVYKKGTALHVWDSSRSEK